MVNFKYRNLTLCVLLLAIGLTVQPERVAKPVKYYPVSLDANSKVYDGDTIQDVKVALKAFPRYKGTEKDVLWPGIEMHGNTLVRIIDIRINGIDTPDKRPRKAGRTEASRQREKAAAAEAQKVLAGILAKHDNKFYLVNPTIGKYAGRIVADVVVGKEKANVADMLIKMGYAVEYIGGTKQKFDDWYKR